MPDFDPTMRDPQLPPLAFQHWAIGIESGPPAAAPVLGVIGDVMPMLVCRRGQWSPRQGRRGLRQSRRYERDRDGVWRGEGRGDCVRVRESVCEGKKRIMMQVS